VNPTASAEGTSVRVSNPSADAPPSTRTGFRGYLHRLADSDLDLRNTWQIIAGAILLPLGIAVILLGWAGAAHGRVEQQQIPYIISGGVLGLALVVIGGFFFWAHWLYRIYDQADLHHQRAMREQAEFYRALLVAVSQGGGAVAAAEAGGAPIGVPTSFVATPSGTNFHTPDCAIVANRPGEIRTIGRDEVDGMRPCRICDPLASK
jgi:heme A synthase